MRPLLFAATFVALVGAACAAAAPEVPVGPDGEVDEVLVLGREIFIGRCAQCHGTSGGGSAGPKLADGAVTETYPDIDDQIEVVTTGRDRMPSFSETLSGAEIEAVVRYTREVLSQP